MLTARLVIASCAVLLLTAGRKQPSSTEEQTVGAWSWSYIEGVGRIVFIAKREAATSLLA